jgi:hypothetical protein
MENQTLQTQTNLNSLLKQLTAMEYDDSVKKSLAVAMQRTDSEISNIDLTIKDIYFEFKNKKIGDIIEAIRQGSLGKYGLTYKLNTQAVCYWINQYLKEKYKYNQDRL